VRDAARQAWFADSATTGAATAARVVAGENDESLCVGRGRTISARGAVVACMQPGKVAIELAGAASF
jgi:hypothetical protein